MTAPRPVELPRLCVGTMNFGRRVDAAGSERIVERALDLGLTFFDTADSYSSGDSEVILGRALGARRRDCQVATKVGSAWRDGRAEGLSPAVIEQAIDESLCRLGTDYVDVYYLHAPDRATPIEQTVEAIGRVVRSGKARAWGVSNYASWQILEMLALCDAGAAPRPVMSQVLYNLLIRELDIEYFAFCRRAELHTTIYNAVAGGLLTGKHRSGTAEAGTRFDQNQAYRQRYWTDRMFEQVRQLEAVARDEGLSLLELAYAWVARRPGVDSILLGPAEVSHLDAAVRACERPVSDGARQRIDELHRAYLGTDTHYAR